MNTSTLIENEIKGLKEEFINVKKCQHSFLLFELTAIGAIFSYLFTNVIGSPAETIIFTNVFSSYIFLMPIIIIVPSLLIILDKAITANRIASFFRVIEHVIVNNTPNFKYVGWENGCCEIRRYYSTHVIHGTSTSLIKTGTQGPNNFYMIIFSLSISFEILSSIFFIYFFLTDTTYTKNLADYGFFIIPIFIIAISIWYLWEKLKQVLKGNCTINAMCALWWKILVPGSPSNPWNYPVPIIK